VPVPSQLNELTDQVDLDVTSAESRGEVARYVAEEYGRVDRLIHLAGVRVAGLFLHTPPERWAEPFAVNYLGAANLTTELMPLVRGGTDGRVVIVTSVGALGGIPGLSLYCASKAAVEGWAESAAMETHALDVSWTLIEPASFRSSIVASSPFEVAEGEPDTAVARHLADLDARAPARRAFAASVVADRIARCCSWRTAPFRLPVGTSAWMRHALRGVAPSRALDRAIARATGLPYMEPRPALPRRPRVLVTGASSGLGRVIAESLHDRGWDVLTTVRSHEKADKLAIDTGIDRESVLVCDQRNDDAVRRAMSKAGRLDAVVANAGMKISGLFEDLPANALEEMIESNTLGTLRVVREAALRMGRSGGRIVVVGSSNGFTGMPTWSGYAASKFALERWADSVRLELSPRNIALTIVEPGAFESEIWREGSTVDSTRAEYQRLIARMHVQDERLAATRTSAAEAAATILRVLTAHAPPARAPVGAGSRIRHAAVGIVPSRAMQAAFGRA
jgi:NAD(P)-dependent dehydrogenase (short-subunit alcohol dehydrogenase family)